MADGSARTKMTPPVSIILEWDNVRLSELARAETMLSRLAEQTRAFCATVDAPTRIELIVLFDPRKLEADAVNRVVGQLSAPGRDVFDLRVVPVEGANYYQLKNAGARLASGELLLFLDSDVIPQPGWFAALVGAFKSPEVQVACGQTYVDPEGWYGKSMALVWFFELPEDTGIKLTRTFWANNVVFRRDLFLAHPFPELPEGCSRGSCTELALQFEAIGIPIHKIGAARVSHPPPNGLGHFVVRALAHGRDHAIRLEERQAQSRVGRATAHFWRTFRRRTSRVIYQGGRVGLEPPSIPPALAVNAAYWGLALGGAWAEILLPGSLDRKVRL